MALKNKPSVYWSRGHFVVRVLGLTGLAVAAVGLAVALIYELLQLNWSSVEENWEVLERAVTTQTFARRAHWAIVLLAAGLVAGLFALIVEVIVILRLAAGRRSAFGFNAFVQIALATMLLIGVNVYAFQNYVRFDWTANQQFTLPENLQKDLRNLQGETTIIVYLPHQSFGQSSKSLDPETRAYFSAAERKVIDKLKDMADQFREFGQQFRVAILDVEDWQNFKTKLDEETKSLPELREAINRTQENTIFFAGQGRVQRLSFNDLFLFDKQRSVEENNLVLLDQGVEPIARKVLAINEKRPKVGIAVIHGWLSTEGREDLPFTMAGLKKTLTVRGFEVKDVVLKKWSRFGPPEPTAQTVEEGKLDLLEERLTIQDNNIKVLSLALAEREKLLQIWQTGSLEELTKKFAADLGGKKVNKETRDDVVSSLKDDVAGLQESLGFYRKRREEILADKNKLNLDSLSEQRRMADVQAKLTRTLADCDLLIVPRLTLRNVVETDENIPTWLHRIDESQADVLRDFVKAGKPILVCFGPTNDGGDRPPGPGAAGPDGVEQMLAKLGVKFVNQTVLFDAETEAFAGRGGGPFGSEANVEVPPVEFDWKPGTGRVHGASAAKGKPHPIRESMRLTARSLGRDAQGKSQLFDLRLRHPQPVYYEGPPGSKLDTDPEFMMTDRASWNEDNPFPTQQRVPEPPKTAPKKGNVEEKRRGPFPIGVAVTTPVPAEWYSDKNVKPTTVRLAVIGHGGVFNGAELSPAKEMLLLDTCNWLLGRDKELSLKEDVWMYPRVEMTSREHAMWLCAALLGLPLFFIYLGSTVVLLRRLR